jgi:hypothetical protein
LTNGKRYFLRGEGTVEGEQRGEMDSELKTLYLSNMENSFAKSDNRAFKYKTILRKFCKNFNEKC